MDKISRINAVLAGEKVDHLPYSAWYHFGLQHVPGEQHGEAQIAFFEAYDMDFLKVMNDYPYPAPHHLPMLETPDQWRELKVLQGNEEGMGEQLKAVEMIATALKNRAYFVETIFSPWTVARRLSDTQTLLTLKRAHPQLLLDVMETIAQSLANYARRVVALGAAGIFLSLSAATPELMTYKEYAQFCRPFDLMILEAIKQETVFNILHIHGRKIFFQELLDYPVQALNWSHIHTAPSIMDARKIYQGCLLGGLDEQHFSHSTVMTIQHQVEQVAELAGKERLIITPGCSIATDSAAKLLQAVHRAVRNVRFS